MIVCQTDGCEAAATVAPAKPIHSTTWMLHRARTGYCRTHGEEILRLWNEGDRR